MKTILPNGNDILPALCKRDGIWRQVTILGEFVPTQEWFAKSERERKTLLQLGSVLCSSRPSGVYLDVRTVRAWFRGDPKTGRLEVSCDGCETWEPYPWTEREDADVDLA